MKILKTTLPLIILAFILTSCQGKVDPQFVQSSEFGLQVKGEMLYVYDPMTWQLAFNRENCEFRVHTDNMSDYYCVRLNCVPTSEGQKAKGSITWTSQKDIITKDGLTFTVQKVERGGRLRLWCRKEDIGVVIQTLD